MVQYSSPPLKYLISQPREHAPDQSNPKEYLYIILLFFGLASPYPRPAAIVRLVNLLLRNLFSRGERTTAVGRPAPLDRRNRRLKPAQQLSNSVQTMAPTTPSSTRCRLEHAQRTKHAQPLLQRSTTSMLTTAGRPLASMSRGVSLPGGGTYFDFLRSKKRLIPPISQVTEVIQPPELGRLPAQELLAGGWMGGRITRRWNSEESWHGRRCWCCWCCCRPPSAWTPHPTQSVRRHPTTNETKMISLTASSNSNILRTTNGYTTQDTAHKCRHNSHFRASHECECPGACLEGFLPTPGFFFASTRNKNWPSTSYKPRSGPRAGGGKEKRGDGSRPNNSYLRYLPTKVYPATAVYQVLRSSWHAYSRLHRSHPRSPLREPLRG